MCAPPWRTKIAEDMNKPHGTFHHSPPLLTRNCIRWYEHMGVHPLSGRPMLNWKQRGRESHAYDVIPMSAVYCPVVVHENYSKETAFAVLPDGSITYSVDEVRGVSKQRRYGKGAKA